MRRLTNAAAAVAAKPAWSCWTAAAAILLACALATPAWPQDVDLAELEEQVFLAAVERVAPAVVQIETLGGRERVGRMLVGQGPKTGLIVSPEGHIVSSAFGFVQKPASILVTLHDGSRLPAEIVSRDNSRMLVLIKVDPPQPLEPPTAARLESMRVGQWAVAVGRTYSRQFPNISVGILSARDRIWGKALQTDAKISPSNYGGPLIDLHGDVLGVLVPLSPDSQSELAGAEWYDSGIGFAIPLADIYERLEQLKQEPLHAGVLGITLKGREIYATEALIAACQVKSPAYLAGIRAGDVVIQCNGQPIERQAQLKHVLGPLYAGETVQLRVRRDAGELEFEVELTDQLVAYEQPFLGILPQRVASSDEEPGVIVRYVYSDSGAARAGIEAGDRVVEVAGQPVSTADALRQVIVNGSPETEISLQVVRGSAKLQLAVTLATVPVEIPPSLPEPVRSDQPDDAPLPADERGEFSIRIPEEPNDCLAYVPKDYHNSRSYGLVVYFTPPGEHNREELIQQWRPLCDEHDLILILPQPTDPSRWQPTEVRFAEKAIELVSDRYRVDPLRRVVAGRAAGGSMAYFVGFRLRETVRAVVAVDGAVPGLLRPPDADPVKPLAIFVATSSNSRLARRIEEGVAALRAMKHPVTVKQLSGDERALNRSELQELARWIDALDRI